MTAATATATDSRQATITALLRKAEGTDNEHEREAYMAKAQKLATQYSIDLQEALQNAREGQRRPELAKKIIKIGEEGTKGLGTFMQLFNGICLANGVKLLSGRGYATAHLYGYDTDIEMVEVLYASLSLQMVRASNAYIASGAYKSDYVYTSRGYKPVHGTSARITFQNAFAARIYERLEEAKKVAMAEYSASHDNSAALVLVNRDKQVQRYYATEGPRRVRQTRGSTSVQSRGAIQAGRSAANRASLGTNSNTVGRSSRGSLTH